MKEYQSLSHAKWDCKYHVVFIPKRRKKKIFGALRRHLGQIFHELAGHKESKVVEGHLMSDHVHICLSIPPKYAVANVVGYIKGKSAIPDRPQVRRPAAKLQRRELLGARVLCVHGRLG
jgi:putative transposase